MKKYCLIIVVICLGALEMNAQTNRAPQRDKPLYNDPELSIDEIDRLYRSIKQLKEERQQTLEKVSQLQNQVLHLISKNRKLEAAKQEQDTRIKKLEAEASDNKKLKQELEDQKHNKEESDKKFAVLNQKYDTLFQQYKNLESHYEVALSIIDDYATGAFKKGINVFVLKKARGKVDPELIHTEFNKNIPIKNAEDLAVVIDFKLPNYLFPDVIPELELVVAPKVKNNKSVKNGRKKFEIKLEHEELNGFHQYKNSNFATDLINKLNIGENEMKNFKGNFTIFTSIRSLTTKKEYKFSESFTFE
jgi:hypothetical protein